jgi:hypothetical protein
MLIEPTAYQSTAANVLAGTLQCLQALYIPVAELEKVQKGVFVAIQIMTTFCIRHLGNMHVFRFFSVITVQIAKLTNVNQVIFLKIQPKHNGFPIKTFSMPTP